VKALVHSVFDQPDAAVHAQFDRIVGRPDRQAPQDRRPSLDTVRADILAFTAYPMELWRQNWSSNPQERLNRKRRRSDVIGIFPDRDSLSASSVLCWLNNTTMGRRTPLPRSRHPQPTPTPNHRPEHNHRPRHRPAKPRQH